MLIASAALLLLTSAYGSGVPGSTGTPTRPVFGERETLPLVASEAVVFFGFVGEFGADGDLEMARTLSEEFELEVVGSPVRAHSVRDRMVFAIRTSEDVKMLDRTLNKGLKKKGFTVEPLSVTALSLLERASGSALSRDMRNVERDETKVWASHIDAGNRLLWAFHEARLKPSKVLDAVRDSGIKASYHHTELELMTKGEADLDEVRRAADGQLDLLRASQRDEYLVLDLYLRGVDSFLALQQGDRTLACPDVLGFLGEVPAGKLSWNVTLETKGFPFHEQ